MVEPLGLWVYGVLDGAVAGPPSCAGVDGEHRVVLIRHARLAAVASAVSLAEYGEDQLRVTLEQLDRLEVIVRAHEHVLDETLELGPVVPFPICTIYSSSEGVRDMLEREYMPMRAALRRLTGMTEWGVKAYRTPRPVAPTPAPASGLDYLKRKRAERESGDSLATTVETVHARLRAVAAASVLSPPQDRRLSGRASAMLLNAAYLVADRDFPGFGAMIEDLSRRYRDDGLELELTGPWPPYHFAQAATR
jgi:hypothetical protein